MSFMASLLWWLLPMLALAVALKKTSLHTSERWLVACLSWAMMSGALMWVLSHAIGSYALSAKWVTLPVLAASFLAFLYLRRKFPSPILTKNEPETLIAGSQTAPKRVLRELAPLIALAFAALVFVGVFVGGIAQIGAASEYYGYAAIARTWITERTLDATVTANVLGAKTMPLAGWTRLGGYVAAQQWSGYSDAVLLAIMVFASLAFIAHRVRALQLPLAVGAAVMALLMITPQFAQTLARHSDVGVVALLAVLTLVALIAPERPGLGLFCAVCAFVWQPTLGWALAFALALHTGLSAQRLRWKVLVAGAACVAMMVLLQADLFLPAHTLAHLRSQSTTLPDWSSFLQGAWAGVLITLLGALALLRARAAASGQRIALLVLTWVALTVIAYRLPWPSYLAATESLHAHLLFVAVAPALLVWCGMSACATAHLLSQYSPAADQYALVSEGSSSTDAQGVMGGHAESAGHSSDIAQPESAARLLGLADQLDLDGMRALLMEGYDALANGDLAGATQRGRAALEYDENHPDAHNLLALVAMQEARMGDALRSVLRAIEVFPEHALYHLTVSEIYGAQERWADQAFALQEASRLDPANVATKTRLLLAKRKALMKAAQRAQTDVGTGEHQAYALIVQRNAAGAKSSEDRA